jgi:Fe-S-cluster containining protein
MQKLETNNKTVRVITYNRNDRCPCGSGIKSKYCHNPSKKYFVKKTGELESKSCFINLKIKFKRIFNILKLYFRCIIDKIPSLSSNKFTCSQCGLCCKKVKVAVLNARRFKLPKKVTEFPYKWDNDGVCEMLEYAEGKAKCKVYENRPVLCRVMDMNKYFKMPVGRYLKANKKACKKLKKEVNN